MEGNITLRSISELLGRNFFIPAYQRGYRWRDEQVTDLLSDLYSFATKANKGEKEFYCLQPVVVAKCDDKNNCYEWGKYQIAHSFQDQVNSDDRYAFLTADGSSIFYIPETGSGPLVILDLSTEEVLHYIYE